jgi:hypothetical protein
MVWKVMAVFACWIGVSAALAATWMYVRTVLGVIDRYEEDMHDFSLDDAD